MKCTTRKDRFGITICEGHTLRPFQEDYHGRIAIVRHDGERFVVDIPGLKDGINFEMYADDCESSMYELEVVSPEMPISYNR